MIKINSLFSLLHDVVKTNGLECLTIDGSHLVISTPMEQIVAGNFIPFDWTESKLDKSLISVWKQLHIPNSMYVISASGFGPKTGLWKELPVDFTLHQWDAAALAIRDDYLKALAGEDSDDLLKDYPDHQMFNKDEVRALLQQVINATIDKLSVKK